MPNRSYSAGTQFRYGFNGQEKDIEVNENITTALFWEYDSRTARRWNIDNKPNVSWAVYSVLNCNPIMNIDKEGDTTYIYNQNGLLKDVVLDKLKTNEIVFMTDAMFDAVNKYPKFKSLDHKALTVRNKNISFAKITSSSVSTFLSNWTGSSKEKGGILYIDKETNEIGISLCNTCTVKKADKAGELDIDGLKEHAFQVSKKYTVIGYFHSHPEDYEAGTQPSSGQNQDLDVGKVISELANGGIGIIVNKSSITVFPLNSKDRDFSDVKLNNNKTNIFMVPYERVKRDGFKYQGQKKYPTFNNKLQPSKI